MTQAWAELPSFTRCSAEEHTAGTCTTVKDFLSQSARDLGFDFDLFSRISQLHAVQHMSLTTTKNKIHPGCCPLLGVRVFGRMLMGPRNPMVCPIHVRRPVGARAAAGSIRCRRLHRGVVLAWDLFLSARRSAHDHRVLIGACDPMLCLVARPPGTCTPTA